MSRQLQLRSLSIHGGYDKIEDYRVTAEFTGYGNKIELRLPGSLGSQIVELCKNMILDEIRTVANAAIEQIEIQDTAKTIEHQTDDQPDDEVPF